MTIVEARPGVEAAASGRPALLVASRDVAPLDPVALVRASLAAGLETAAWLRPSEGLAMVGIGRAWATEPTGPDRFRAAEAAWTAPAAELAGAGVDAGDGPVLLGGMGFLGERAADPGPWTRFPVASLVLPSLLLRIRAGRASLTLAGTGPVLDDAEATWAALTGAARAPGHAPRPRGVAALMPRSTPDRAGWERLVGLMSGAVGRGRLDKVVLARRVDLELTRAPDPASTLEALAAGAPESAAFLFARDGAVFVGATPERLARVEGKTFRTVAIAGSTRRGRDAAEDDAFATALLASDKDREEHAIVVDELRARLAPLASELRVAPAPAVLPLRDLQHLVTPIEGSLRERAGLLSLAGLLHPTPLPDGRILAAR